jgi:hypothetical protein
MPNVIDRGTFELLQVRSRARRAGCQLGQHDESAHDELLGENCTDEHGDRRRIAAAR